MTSNKAQKNATRQRMAETGEPYSVARKATAGRAEHEVSETPEERYLRDAEASGVSEADLDVMRAVFQARKQRDRLRQAAELAREQADEAEEAAVRAEERADRAQEAAAEEDDPNDGETAGPWHEPWPGAARFPRPPRLPKPPEPPSRRACRSCRACRGFRAGPTDRS